MLSAVPQSDWTWTRPAAPPHTSWLATVRKIFIPKPQHGEATEQAALETTGSEWSCAPKWCKQSNDDDDISETSTGTQTNVKNIHIMHQEITTYDTDTASTALTTNTATNSVQDGRVGVQISAWYGAVLPTDVLHANLIARRSVSPTLCCLWTTLSSTHDN